MNSKSLNNSKQTQLLFVKIWIKNIFELNTFIASWLVLLDMDMDSRYIKKYTIQLQCGHDIIIYHTIHWTPTRGRIRSTYRDQTVSNHQITQSIHRKVCSVCVKSMVRENSSTLHCVFPTHFLPLLLSHFHFHSHPPFLVMSWTSSTSRNVTLSRWSGHDSSSALSTSMTPPIDSHSDCDYNLNLLY